MRLNLPLTAIAAMLCIAGGASLAPAAPTNTDRSAVPGGFRGNLIAPVAEFAKAKPQLRTQYAAKKRHTTAKKAPPKPRLDEAAMGEAVREFLTKNPGVLRGAIIEVLRSDPEVGKLLTERGAVTQAPATPAAPLTADQGRIEEIVRNYLLRNPEVLQEVIAELEKRQALAEAQRHKAAITANAELLFNSPRQVVLGNPNGDVTFVEFFDYNCAYCKRAMADMFELMKTDPKLKIVLKEFPVLGKGSVEAAEVSTAARLQDKTGKKYLEFHTKLMMSRGQVDRARALAVAKEVGLDMARLERDMAGDEVRASIEESLKLAEALGLNGTPSYVVGPNVVIGAVGVAALREKVNAARCGKATC